MSCYACMSGMPPDFCPICNPDDQESLVKEVSDLHRKVVPTEEQKSEAVDELQKYLDLKRKIREDQKKFREDN